MLDSFEISPAWYPSKAQERTTDADDEENTLAFVLFLCVMFLIAVIPHTLIPHRWLDWLAGRP